MIVSNSRALILMVGASNKIASKLSQPKHLTVLVKHAQHMSQIICMHCMQDSAETRYPIKHNYSRFNEGCLYLNIPVVRVLTLVPGVPLSEAVCW